MKTLCTVFLISLIVCGLALIDGQHFDLAQNVNPPQTFTVSIVVSINNFSSTCVFGVNPNSTSAYNPSYDSLASFPSDAKVHAYFNCYLPDSNHPQRLSRYVVPSNGSTTWILGVQSIDQEGTLTIAWNDTTVSSMTLADGIISQIVYANMNAVNNFSYVASGGAVSDFKIVYQSPNATNSSTPTQSSTSTPTSTPQASPTLTPTKASPKTIIVPDDFTTIQDAIAVASGGDTVFVRAGNYSLLGGYDGLLIDKSISLVGESSQNTVITVGQYRYGHDAIHIQADNVTVSGFNIDGGGIQMGIDVEDSYSHVPIGCKIIGNFIHNCGVAIDAYGSTNTLTLQIKYLPSYLTISGNTLSGNDRGIYMEASNSTVIGNVIDSNKDVGIIVDECLFLNISNNTISNNGFASYDGNGGGIWLRWWGPFYINGNVITSNHGYGIGFEEFCNNSTVWGNDISKNDFGIREYLVQYGGFGNVVYENNLIDNQLQVAVNQTLYSAVNVNQTDAVSLDNGRVGNYWSDYLTKYPHASEVDSTGVGNTPVVIDQNNVDNHPLISAFNISAVSPLPTLSPSPSVPEFPAWTILLVVIAVVSLTATVIRSKKLAETKYAYNQHTRIKHLRSQYCLHANTAMKTAMFLSWCTLR